MKRIIHALCMWSVSTALFANNGIKVHAFDKEFSVPENCEFYVAPSATAGETRFNCAFYSPLDEVTINFRNKEHCDKSILPRISKDSKINKVINGIQYVEKTVKIENSNIALTWRVISNEKICIYAVGIYSSNLDTVLNGLWEQ
jgi:hypothetical protein